MKRIYVLVEGHSEREFVSRILAPYFEKEGLYISPIPMKKSGGGMGYDNLEHFKNHVEPLLYYADLPVITTFIDLFRFPVNSSVHAEKKLLEKHRSNPDIEARIYGFYTVLSAAVQKIRPYDHFTPYIQKHEFEALLFCDAEVFDIEDERIKFDIEAVLKQTPNPEDINTTAMGHPAKRLGEHFCGLQKKVQKKCRRC